jgi:PAS domain S-box-containing protein
MDARDRDGPAAPKPLPQRAARLGARPIGAALLLGVGYYAGAQAGYALRAPGSPSSMLAPANALLLAAFLLAPTRWWWPLLAGALPAHLAVHLQHGVPPATTLGLFLTSGGQALLGAAPLRRLFPGPFALDSLRRVGTFVVCAALLAPLAIAFAAAALIVGTGRGADYWGAWQDQSLSNILTLLTLVPAILALAAGETAWRGRAAPRRWAEFGLLLAGLLAATGVVFSNGADPAHIAALTYLPLPFLLWAALRFGTGGVAVAVLVVAGWAVRYAARGPGPFGGLSPAENVRSLQLYLITVAVPLLALAGLLREREMTARLLRAIFQQATDAILIVDDAGRCAHANPAACTLLGAPDEAALAGRWLGDFAGPAAGDAVRDLWRQFLAEGALAGTYAIRRPDGTARAAECRAVARIRPGQHLAVLRDVTERARAEAERAASRRVLAAAREAERLRLARELHDTAVQQLLGVSFQLAAHRAAGGGADPVPVPAAALTDLRAAVLDTVALLRGLIGELRPAGLEEFGLRAALEGYLGALRRERGSVLPAIVVDLDDVGDDLPQDVGLCLFRVAQEALRNAIRHAGAREVVVTLRREDAEVAVRVCDDGRGFRVPGRLSAYTQAGHFGLAGMCERVQLAGGRFGVESAPGAGTVVTATCPLGAEGGADGPADPGTPGR